MTIDDYQLDGLIGEGSFGKVFKGVKKYTGQVVAMKFISKSNKSKRDLDSFRQEIVILKGLQHPNIIQMLDNYETEKEFIVITEFANGELFEVLEDEGRLPEDQCQLIAKQLVAALDYLHRHRIIHRDMKPQNILIGSNSRVKLCDFGFARSMSTKTEMLTSIKGTPLYMAPELVQEKPYDHTVDLWSLGVILFELFTGYPPFYTDNIFKLIHLIIGDSVQYPPNMSKNFKSFLESLLQKNPKHRPTWKQLRMHAFVNGNKPSRLPRAPSPSSQAGRNR